MAQSLRQRGEGELSTSGQRGTAGLSDIAEHRVRGVGAGPGGGAGGGDPYTRLKATVRARKTLQHTLDHGSPPPVRRKRDAGPAATQGVPEREVDGIRVPDESNALATQHTVNMVLQQRPGKLRVKVGGGVAVWPCSVALALAWLAATTCFLSGVSPSRLPMVVPSSHGCPVST